jgi:6-phosphogluconolactonase
LRRSVKIFPTPLNLAESFAVYMTGLINKSVRLKQTFSVALSGGSTPELLFTLLGENFSGSVPWEYVHFFWGDERCVPPGDPESNFRLAKIRFFDKIKIPPQNIHRIKGEEEPSKEAIRYSFEISDRLRERDGLPVFDLIILGLGEDGHTASIFPQQSLLITSGNICEVAVHPVSFQRRITITCKTINNASVVTFLVTGKSKADIVEKILHNLPSALNFPASHIVPVYGEVVWFIDENAASLL